jgi:hypothetical protein
MYIKQPHINRGSEETEVNAIIKREKKNMGTMPRKLRADNKNEANSTDETYRFNIQDRRQDPTADTGPRPIIFQKKKTLRNLKPLKYVANDTGKTRHYPPGAQEWLNSIYTYNKNLIKTLPLLDQNLFYLLKSYYNMGISHKTLNIKRRLNRFRRLSPRKVFVGKGDIKHTNSKVIISVYLYNTEKMYLMRKIKKQFKYLFLARSPIMIAYSENRNGKMVVSHNRPYTFDEFVNTPTESLIRYKPYPLRFQKKLLTYREVYLSSIRSAVRKITTLLKKINKYYEYLSEIVEKQIITKSEKLLIFAYKIPRVSFVKFPEHNDNLELAK